MRVFYTTSDGGDGSSSVSFFESQKCIDMIEEADPDTYGSGEGGSWFEVPDGTPVTGITIHTEAECEKAVENGKSGGFVFFD